MRVLLSLTCLLASAPAVAAQSGTARRSLADEASFAAGSVAWGVTAPLHWSSRTWLGIGASTLGLAAISTLDAAIRDAARRNRSGSVDALARDMKPFGREGSAGALGAFLVAAIAFGDERARAVAFDGIAASALASGLLVPALQAAIGRSRPWHERGEYDFKAFSGRHSLPSGHTAQAFVTASVIAAHYNAVWADITAYGVASAVGLSRMVHDAHHLTDVMAGAAIGTLIGRAVVSRGAGSRSGARITPAVGHGSLGIEVRF